MRGERRCLRSIFVVCRLCGALWCFAYDGMQASGLDDGGATSPNVTEIRGGLSLPWTLMDREKQGGLIFGQLHAGYRAQSQDEDQFQEFDLTRAELGVLWGSNDVGLVLNLEAVRAVGSQSLLGLDGDSLVMRVRHGFGYWGGAWGWFSVQAQAGLIPDIWKIAVESFYMLRGISSLGAERSGLMTASDLGGSVSVGFWENVVVLRAALTNGEGRNQIERNEGKNITVALSGRLWRPVFWDGRGMLYAHVSYRDGSVGEAQARAHRAMGALTFAHPRCSAGVEWGYAWGLGARPEVEATQSGGWISSDIISELLGVFARYDWMQADTSVDASDIRTLLAGLYIDAPRWESLRRFRLYVGYEQTWFDDQSAVWTSLPESSDIWSMNLRLELVGAQFIFTETARAQ
jgi:hypothetical protein